MRPKPLLIGLGFVLAIGIGTIVFVLWPEAGWSTEQVTALRGLWLGSLQPLAADPSNRVADDPRATTLGHKLFFDSRFSANGAVSCASCHVPAKNFNDGLPLGKGVGTTDRKTMTVVGTAYSPWLFWDGRKDSLWAQALGPLENPVEHGGTRSQYAHLIATYYRQEYEALFGPLPDLSDHTRFPLVAAPVNDPAARAAWEGMRAEDREAVTTIYVNMGKTIAAYERKLMPGPSRFDQYVAALLADDPEGMRQALAPEEEAGARLFIGKAQCINCHNTPLFSDNSFHNTGVPAAAGLPEDVGRAKGAQEVLLDEFNCLSQWSDAKPEECAELRFLVAEGEGLNGAFRPTTLRNIAEMAPYMHAGQFATLREVLEHYNRAAVGPVGHSELQPLRLSERELAYLEAFLRALSGGVNAPAELLAPPALPSACKGCHPPSDELSTHTTGGAHP
jgi:cytochrome c peroxidase